MRVRTHKYDCPFFSLCLQIPHIRSFSIIQKKYLIFIPKWKLFYNVVWKREEDGSKGKGGRKWLEVEKDREMMVCVCSVDGWLHICICLSEFLKSREGKTGESVNSSLHPHKSKQTQHSSRPRRWGDLRFTAARKCNHNKMTGCEWRNWMQQ